MIVYYRMDDGDILSVNVVANDFDDLDCIAKACAYDYWVSEGLDDSDCPIELKILSGIEGEPLAHFSIEIQSEPTFHVNRL